MNKASPRSLMHSLEHLRDHNLPILQLATVATIKNTYHDSCTSKTTVAGGERRTSQTRTAGRHITESIPRASGLLIVMMILLVFTTPSSSAAIRGEEFVRSRLRSKIGSCQTIGSTLSRIDTHNHGVSTPISLRHPIGPIL